ncbi:invertebrate-type lysozyme 3-like [Planococcus citri]|uniref:invertebrate-type lysozyme 3-like n=1 Tax=Planococcus citri TaxID=170843 RepID=UPI0031F7E9F3
MNKFGALISSLFLLYASWNFSQAAQTPQIKVPADSNWCLGCICEAISGCNRSLQCSGDVCGLFRITWAYWADAGKPTVKNEDPNSQYAYANCTNNEVCAGTTVSNYLRKFAKDCNGDGQIDCYDYAAIHKYGGYSGCTTALSGEYYTKFSTCEKHLQTLGTNQSGTQ